MFEEYQNQRRKKTDEWFYPTIAFGVVTVVAVTIFTLDFAGLVSVSRWFSEGMKIEGEMSVVPAAGEPRVNLGGAKICLVPEDRILEWVNIKNEKAIIESKKARLNLDYARYTKSRLEREADAAATDAERARVQSLQTAKAPQMEKAEADYRYWSSPAYYFSGLKDCAARAVTDAQGRFSFTAKPGKYALAAEAGREVTNLKENHFWLIWITPETTALPITLDNNNLMTANPVERVVEIKDL